MGLFHVQLKRGLEIHRCWCRPHRQRRHEPPTRIGCLGGTKTPDQSFYWKGHLTMFDNRLSYDFVIYENIQHGIYLFYIKRIRRNLSSFSSCPFLNSGANVHISFLFFLNTLSFPTSFFSGCQTWNNCGMVNLLIGFTYSSSIMNMCQTIPRHLTCIWLIQSLFVS